MTRLLERPQKERLTPARRDHKLPAVEPAKPIDLDHMLADQPAGAWVVLDANMTCVLGSAASPEEALSRAKAQTKALRGATLDSRSVLMQVPDPLLLRI